MKQTDFIEIGQQKGTIQILDEGTTIHYVVPDKQYTFTDPEERVRAKITPCMENGKSAVVDNLEGGIGLGSTEFHVFRALEGINIAIFTRCEVFTGTCPPAFRWFRWTAKGFK